MGEGGTGPAGQQGERSDVTNAEIANCIRGLILAVDSASEAHGSEFTAGCPARVDWLDNEVSGAWGVQLLQDSYRTALMYSWYVRDHAAALADAIESGRTLAYLTLARGLAESSARCWYLLQPDVDGLERVRRLVNDLLFASFEDDTMMRSAVGGVEDRSHARDAIRTEASRRGLTFVDEVREAGKFRPARLGERRPGSRDLLSRMTGNDAGAAWFYRMTSGVGHTAVHSLRGRLRFDVAAGRAGIAALDADRVFGECTFALQAYMGALGAIMFQTGWSSSQLDLSVDRAEDLWDRIVRG